MLEVKVLSNEHHSVNHSNSLCLKSYNCEMGIMSFISWSAYDDQTKYGILSCKQHYK